MAGNVWTKTFGLLLTLVGLWMATTVVSFSGLLTRTAPAEVPVEGDEVDWLRVVAMAGIGLAMALVGGWLVTAPEGGARPKRPTKAKDQGEKDL